MATEKISEIFDIQAIQKQITIVENNIKKVLSLMDDVAKKAVEAGKQVGAAGNMKEMTEAIGKVNKVQEEYVETTKKLNSLKQMEANLRERFSEMYTQEMEKLSKIRQETEAYTKSVKDKINSEKTESAQAERTAQARQKEVQQNKEVTTSLNTQSAAYKNANESASAVLGTLNQNISLLSREKASLKEVQKELSILNKTQELGKKLTDEQRAKRSELIKKEFEHKQAISELNQTIKNEVKANQSAATSMDGLSQTLSRLKAAYRSLTREERNSPLGKQLLGNIKSTDTELSKLDAEIGNHQRNVGNYGSVWRGVQGALTKVLGVVGVVKTALKGVSAVINSTQTTGDSFRFSLSELKAQWELLKKSIATADFSLFTRNASDAANAARELAQALDETFERMNSINLRKAKIAPELAELRDNIINSSLSDEERLEAVKKYEEAIKGFYTETTAVLKKNAEAQLNNFAARVKGINQTTEEAAKEMMEYIEKYNPNLVMIEQANNYLQALKDIKLAEAESWVVLTTGKIKTYNKLQEEILSYKNTINSTSQDVIKFSNLVAKYNLSNDKEISGIVQSWINYYDSLAAMDNELRRVRSQGYAAKKRMDDKEKSEAEKQEEENRKFAENEENFQKKHADILLETELNMWEKMSQDEKLNYESRLTALINFYDTRKQIIEKNRDDALSKSKSPSETAYINEQANLAISQNNDKGNKAIQGFENNEIIKRINNKINEINSLFGVAQNELQQNFQKEQLELARQYADGILKREDYEEAKLKLAEKYHRQELQQQINYLNKIAALDLPADKALAAKEKLARAEADLAKWEADQEIEQIERVGEARKKDEGDWAAKWEKRLAQISQISNVIGSTFSQIYENRIQNIDNEIEKIDEEKEAQLEALDEMEISEDEREERKEAIEKKAEKQRKLLEKKKRDEQRKQAIIDRTNAMIQIAVDTAVGMIHLWRDPGGLAGIALMSVLGALSAAQMIAVAAQPLPKYAKGTEDHPGGPAIVGDGGKKEVIITPEGEYYITPNTPTVINIPAHSEILPDFSKAITSLATAPRLDTDITNQSFYGYVSLKNEIKELGDRLERSLEKNRSNFSVSLDKNGVWKAYDEHKGNTTYINERLNLRR